MRYKILFFEWKFHVKILATTEVIQTNSGGWVFILPSPFRIGGICHAIHQYAEANIKKWKIMIKIKNDLILSIGM